MKFYLTEKVARITARLCNWDFVAWDVGRFVFASSRSLRNLPIQLIPEKIFWWCISIDNVKMCLFHPVWNSAESKAVVPGPTLLNPTAASAGPQENFCTGGIWCSQNTVVCVAFPQICPLSPIPWLCFLWKQLCSWVSVGEISALTCWLEYSGWFVIVLQTSLEVFERSVCI